MKHHKTLEDGEPLPRQMVSNKRRDINDNGICPRAQMDGFGIDLITPNSWGVSTWNVFSVNTSKV